jgi:hypothetical protein
MWQFGHSYWWCIDKEERLKCAKRLKLSTFLEGFGRHAMNEIAG